MKKKYVRRENVTNDIEFLSPAWEFNMLKRFLSFYASTINGDSIFKESVGKKTSLRSNRRKFVSSKFLDFRRALRNRRPHLSGRLPLRGHFGKKKFHLRGFSKRLGPVRVLVVSYSDFDERLPVRKDRRKSDS